MGGSEQWYSQLVWTKTTEILVHAKDVGACPQHIRAWSGHRDGLADPVARRDTDDAKDAGDTSEGQ